MSEWDVFHQRWLSGGAETDCGVGSTWKRASSFAMGLQKWLSQRKNYVQTRISINDAGCGDQNWARRINWTGIDYLGYDLHPYPSLPLPFQVLNIAEKEMRRANFILCRDVLFHFPDEIVEKTLKMFAKSSPILIATSHRQEILPKRHSWDAKIQRCYSPLDLTRFLGKPLEIITREPEDRFIALWRLN